MDCKTPRLMVTDDGIVQGSSGNSTILVMAHANSVFGADANTCTGSRLRFHNAGPGIADNAIGLAAVVAL